LGGLPVFEILDAVGADAKLEKVQGFHEPIIVP
jgi:hypothetical protein